MRKNKGFTLIELLAVIVILAVIATITIPLVIGVIDQARRSAYKQGLTSIFDATDLYLVSSGFVDLPDEGINVRDEKLKINHNDFTSGKIIKNEQGNFELERVSNGLYCGNGILDDIRVIQGSCDQLDTTPPINTIATSNLVTSSLITIVATADDLESGINGYQFSKDNGTTWTSKQMSNVYIFNGLTNNTSYTFKVRAINNNLLSAESSEINVTTTDIPIPIYSVNTTNWSTSKTVTITYPVRETGYVYEYSLDNAITWQTIVAPTTAEDITFNANGNVIARILDGTNEISGASYAVANIDTVNPTVVINVEGTPFNAGGWANGDFNVNVQSNDVASGINYYNYCQTTSATCIPTTRVDASSGIVTITTESATNKICAQAFDNANNSSIVVCSSDYKLDKTAPIVGDINTSGTVGTNGWYTSNVTISKVDGGDTMSGHATTTLSHTSITSDTTGTMVILTTTDNADNTVTRNQFIKMDKTIPIITVNPTSVSIGVGGVYTESGVQANDNLTGDLTSNIIRTGTINVNLAGSYPLTYNVSDAAGNAAVFKIRTVNVIQSVASFNYIGTQQSYTIPVTGKYKLEVWGSAGGEVGGKGGYAVGEHNFNANDIVYIHVGQQGNTSTTTSYNGGGRGGNQSVGAAGGGGGATDFRTVSGTWNSVAGLNSRLIVAGGGGGGASTYSCNGGVGGGSTGFKPTSGYSGELDRAGSGGTQSGGGPGGKTAYPGNDGYFGVGGDCYAIHGAGGGGGGWYGGGAGAHAGGGGGGSGYIGGVTGGQNLAGNQSFPAPGGGTETGHSGNGYARVTFISQ